MQKEKKEKSALSQFFILNILTCNNHNPAAWKSHSNVSIECRICPVKSSSKGSTSSGSVTATHRWSKTFFKSQAAGSCSYGWFTKVNRKSHNSSFHLYDLLSSSQLLSVQPLTAAQSLRAKDLKHIHRNTHQCLQRGINTIHHIPTQLASFPSHLTWVK